MTHLLDHETARHIYRDVRSVNVGIVDSAFIGTNPKRVGLLIVAPPTNRFTISLAGPAILDQGITLYPSTQPLQLFTRDWGDAIKEDLRAISQGVAQNITFVDLFTG